jgi:hypothetical protein
VGGESERRTTERVSESAGTAQQDLATDAASPGIARMLQLQRSVGNRALAAFLNAAQPRLTVGAADDPDEHQADVVADQVMSLLGADSPEPHPNVPQAEPLAEHLHRQTSPPPAPAADEIGLSGGDLDADSEVQLEKLRGGGSSLPTGVRESMEGAFGADFGDVRVHRGQESEHLNRSMGAAAFTVGSDIYLGAGRSLEHPSGQRLLAHELTHVVQQRGAGARRSVIRRAPETIAVEWKDQSAVKGKPRSKALKEIDKAVEKWVNDKKVFGLPAMFTANLAYIDTIEQKIAEWKATKDDASASIRAAKITELESFLAAQKMDCTDRKTKKEDKEKEAKVKHGVFHSSEAGMAKYSGRSTKDYAPERFETIKKDTYQDLLSRDRDVGNKLTDDVVNLMVEKDKAEGAKDIATSQSAKIDIPKDATEADIEKLLKDPRYINPVTGKTMFPELEGLLAEMKNKTIPVPDKTEVFDVGATKITATYNPGDVNYDARWAQIKAAVEKVQSAGWVVPNFKLSLPKLGRSISISKSATDCSVTEGAKSNRAVFWAPDLMHVSSANFENPLSDKGSMQETKTKFKYSSTEIDPSGVGTIVHELGHMLHFHNDPKKFQGLWGTMFKGKGKTKTGGETTLEMVAATEVSEYGNKPREMVAEVFLGMVYGRKYSKQIMDVYDALGGAPKA